MELVYYGLLRYSEYHYGDYVEDYDRLYEHNGITEGMAHVTFSLDLTENVRDGYSNWSGTIQSMSILFDDGTVHYENLIDWVTDPVLWDSHGTPYQNYRNYISINDKRPIDGEIEGQYNPNQPYFIGRIAAEYRVINGNTLKHFEVMLNLYADTFESSKPQHYTYNNYNYNYVEAFFRGIFFGGEIVYFGEPLSDPITDPIPEPATLTLLGLGMAGMAYRKLRK